MDKLNDGAIELRDGMDEFNEESIEKITDVLENNGKITQRGGLKPPFSYARPRYSGKEPFRRHFRCPGKKRFDK